MYYRFKNGVFVEAESFIDAKAKLIEQIQEEVEVKKRWVACTCLGLQHRHDCPVGKAAPICF